MKYFSILIILIFTSVNIIGQNEPVGKILDELFYDQSTPYSEQIVILDSVLAISESDNDRDGIVLTHLMLAKRYIHTDRYQKAQSHLNKAYDLGGDVAQSHANYLSGVVFMDMDNYNKAISRFEKVVHFDEKYFKEKQMRLSLLNVMAVCHEELGEYEKARKFYTEAIELADASKNIDVLIAPLSNKAMLLSRYFQEHEEALKLLFEARNLCIQADRKVFLSFIYGYTVEVKLANGDLDSVLFYIDQSNQLANDFSMVETLMNNKYLRANYFKKTNQLDSAYYYLDSFSAMKDSLENVRSEKQINQLQEHFEADQREKLITKKKEEIEELKNEEKNARQKLLIIVGFTLLSLVSFIVIVIKLRGDLKKKNEIFRIRKELDRAKLQNKELESIRLSQDLKIKNNSLTDLAIDISRKKEFTEDILQKLKQLKRTKEKDQLLNDLIGYTSRQLNIDDRLSLLWDNVESINYDFFDKLSSKHPELTKGETQLCTLMRLKLSNKDIATIKNITPDSAKNMRSRLRKKLQLQVGVGIQDYLINI